MAISHALVPFTGRVGDVVYYYVGNEIYCRTIFPNIRKRVMKDERYALFRVYSGLFGQSSKIASAIYRELGVEDVKLYRTIVGEATRLFKHTGMKGDEVMKILWVKWVDGIRSPEVTNNGLEATNNFLEVCRHGETKKVIEKNIGKTVREHIQRLQRRKVRQVGGMVVGSEAAVEKAVIEKVPLRTEPEKRMRIVKAEVKIRWKDNEFSWKKKKIDSAKHDENSMSYVSLNDTVVRGEKTLNSV